MKIYTRAGDSGTTSLFGGRKVVKNDPQLIAYGSVDELNAFIGLVKAKTKNPEIKKILFNLQKDLMAISAYLSGYPKKIIDLDKKTIEIEKIIDQYQKKLPQLHNFLIPGGSEEGALFHVVRTITRRVERKVVGQTKQKEILKYLNRLSDLFFVLARFANKEDNTQEEIWKDN